MIETKDINTTLQVVEISFGGHNNYCKNPRYLTEITIFFEDFDNLHKLRYLSQKLRKIV